MDFQKNRAKWQHSMVNHQRLTPPLTITFSKITQPVTIQTTFVMLSVDDFSQDNKSDTINQRANPTETKFPTV